MIYGQVHMEGRTIQRHFLQQERMRMIMMLFFIGVTQSRYLFYTMAR